jgi:hypothetical protein
MSAAPVAAPRRRPSPRKASSLAVTRGQGPRCPAPPGAPSLPASVATRPRRVNPRSPALAGPGPLVAFARDGASPKRAPWPATRASSRARSAPLGDPCACTGSWPGDRLTMPATRPRGAGS